MGIRTRLVDWLGKTLADSVPKAVAEEAYHYERCHWMEVAREAVTSYVVAAMQLTQVKFYRDGKQSYADEAWLWNVSPNPNQSRAEFVSDLVHGILEDGAAIVVPYRHGGRTSIYVADATPTLHPGRETAWGNVTIEGDTRVVPGSVPAGQLYRFALSGDADAYAALNALMRQEYDALAESAEAAMRDHGSQRWIYKLTQPPNGTRDEVERQKAQLQENLKRFVTSDQAAVMPLYSGQDLQRVADGRTNPVTPDMVAAIRRDMFSMVAACLRMPASVLDGNVNNFSATMSAFLTFGVDPVARLMSDELTRKTFTAAEWAAGDRAVVDTSRIQHMDLLSAADQVEKLIGSSIVSPNEMRGFTALDPIREPWADEYQRTKNHEDAGGGEQNDQA